MRKILVSCRLIKDRYGACCDQLDMRWHHLLASIECVPIMVPSGYDVDTFVSNIEWDGLLLTGGNTLASCDNNSISKHRDAIEAQLLTQAINKGLPVFGVCRGMQLIAHFFGSTLQPLKDRVESHVATKHTILPSRTGNSYDITMREVNSYHTFAIDKLSDSLQVLATSTDNIVEAFCHCLHSIVGIMWHPEREEVFHPADQILMADVFNSTCAKTTSRN